MSMSAPSTQRHTTLVPRDWHYAPAALLDRTVYTDAFASDPNPAALANGNGHADANGTSGYDDAVGDTADPASFERAQKAEARRRLEEDEALQRWTPCARFPSEVHDELRERGVVPDWNKGRGEHDVQWVSKVPWAYRATIDIDDTARKLNSAELVFESIDTFGTIYLIHTTDNHFRTWRVPVNPTTLLPSNELIILLSPPQDVAHAVGRAEGPFRGGSCNLGDRARIGIRKTQYHARWDWGPELWCMGIDRPVHLHVFDTRIKEVHTAARVDEGLGKTLKVDVDVEGESVGAEVQVQVTLQDLSGREIRSERIQGKGKSLTWKVDEVELWWPVNEGPQTRYQVQVDLVGAGTTLDTHTRTIGFRRAELVQHPLTDQPGTSFFFRINNRPVFIGGSNWIPIDMVLSRGTPEGYRRWLEMMVRGKQNMVRVWGGGVFEPSAFYDMCDELGLLVWQDFMFACGVYPIFPDFMRSVEAEVRDNVTRLRHHPSLVMMCGNNEDYQQILQWDMKQSGDPLPARKIYEGLLPSIVAELTDPAIPYWPGSPFGGKGWDTTDPTTGDIHQWDVWAGKERNYHDWDLMGGRFVSEFGLPAMPDRRTIDWWLDGEDGQAYPQSRIMQQHNKAGSHERRFAGIMNENFRLTGDLTEYVFRNQLMQAESVGAAYRAWRREWRGDGKEYCGGVLVWQLNDCFPVTSWALIDYFYRPKPVYYAIARALSRITLGSLRIVRKNRENDRPRQYYEYGAFQSGRASVQVWAGNSGQTAQVAVLVMTPQDVVTGWRGESVRTQVTLPPNQTSEVWAGDCPEPPRGSEWVYDRYAPSGSVVLHFQLEAAEADGAEILARWDDWPMPYKSLELRDPEVRVRWEGGAEGTVVLSAKRPAKGVWLDVEGYDEGVEWSDNSIDVFPGEEYRIQTKGVKGRRITYASLGWEKGASRVTSL